MGCDLLALLHGCDIPPGVLDHQIHLLFSFRYGVRLFWLPAVEHEHNHDTHLEHTCLLGFDRNHGALPLSLFFFLSFFLSCSKHSITTHDHEPAMHCRDRELLSSPISLSDLSTHTHHPMFSELQPSNLANMNLNLRTLDLQLLISSPPLPYLGTSTPTSTNLRIHPRTLTPWYWDLEFNFQSTLFDFDFLLDFLLGFQFNFQLDLGRPVRPLARFAARFPAHPWTSSSPVLEQRRDRDN
jgi:hypothetical protein